MFADRTEPKAAMAAWRIRVLVIGFVLLAIDMAHASTLMPLPAFNATYSSSLTRGYWFTAPVDFVITGLRVPDESSHGLQNIEVVRFTAGPPPTFSGTTNSFVSLVRFVGQPSASILAVNIPVSAGDVIGILGAAGDTGLMRNSYAPSGAFVSDIDGQAVTLTRMGMQYPLDTTAAQDIWQEPTGPIARVEMYYVVDCGNSVIDPGEECDDGNLDDGDCCSSSCLFEVAGSSCASDGLECTDDVCDGAGACTHQVTAAGTSCRTSAGPCDLEEVCDGVSTTCPADGFDTGSECRAAAGPCDVAETCDGTGVDCPTDGFDTGSICRPSVGVCDLEDTCDGSGVDCPTDAKSTTECRAVAGVCDVAESCDGVGDDCPADGFESGGVCRPAAGVCDLEETCDGGGADCPVDAKSSALCRPDAGVCDVAESCDGVTNDCPADGFEPNGTSCSDGAFCNGDETCQGGSCEAGAEPCLLLCDESGDVCETGCPDSPQTCRSSEKGIVLFKDKDDDAKDKLVWKWIKGDSTSQTELGDPSGSTDYVWCLYAGTSAALVAEATVPPSSTLWSELSNKGYKYKDNALSADGVQKVVLKGSDKNKSKALLKGKGTDLPDPALPLALPVTVQLFNGDTGVCMDTTFQSGDVKKNEAGQFKAKAKTP